EIGVNELFLVWAEFTVHLYGNSFSLQVPSVNCRIVYNFFHYSLRSGSAESLTMTIYVYTEPFFV
ncbi:MAG: hypothetical protein R6U84_02020, partial [Candidatus Cloacimonadales bacterium]